MSQGKTIDEAIFFKIYNFSYFQILNDFESKEQFEPLHLIIIKKFV